MSLISATSWVPRGFASEFPIKYEFDDEEMDKIAGLARLQLKEAQDDWEDEEEEEEETSSKSKVETLKKEKDHDDGEYVIFFKSFNYKVLN